MNTLQDIRTTLYMMKDRRKKYMTRGEIDLMHRRLDILTNYINDLIRQKELACITAYNCQVVELLTRQYH